MTHNKKLLVLLFVILTLEALTTGLLPITKGHLFGYFEAKNSLAWLALLYFFLNYVAIDFCQCFKGYIVLRVALWYRELRTNKIFGKLGIAKLNPSKSKTLPTNSPQRIQEDIKLSYLSRISVWVEYYVSGLILVQLILLNLSEPLLLGLAALYALVSVAVALKFNPRLTKAEIDIQQSEADYRTGLFANILDISGMYTANKACLKSKWIQTEYLLFTKLQLGLVAVLPYLTLLPKLLEGSMTLGVMVQHSTVFGLFVVNMAILIQLYPTLIQGIASDKRVRELE